jgi:protein arginine kinase activator
VGGKERHAVEIHLCLEHAVAGGLLTPMTNEPTQTLTIKPATEKIAPQDAAAAIVPASQEPTGLAVTHGPSIGDAQACPSCGMTWAGFKQSGIMGCSHDYEQFSSKLLPLLKRAQEGAAEHVGKTPARRKTHEGDRQVTTLRLRRELQKALNAENYEHAAQVRDKLRSLEQN